MISSILLLLLILTELSISSVIPSKEDDHKSASDRKHENADAKHHFDGDNNVHNSDYDHDVFLGKDEAKTFDQLTPEESQKRLSAIFGKIDTDQDNFVTGDELRAWIVRVQQRYTQSETAKQWAEHGLSDNDKLSWERYIDNQGNTADEEQQQDKRRWEAADQNHDNFLDKEEFGNFLHPEDVSHMRHIYVKETLEEIDANNDGYISLEEFLDDLWNEEDREDSDNVEPDWLDEEREDFAKNYDQNGDGLLDEREVERWILPESGSLTDEEVIHLLDKADGDKDNRLSRKEVLDNYELFVGSQATDYGDVLMRHDEF